MPRSLRSRLDALTPAEPLGPDPADALASVYAKLAALAGVEVPAVALPRVARPAIERPALGVPAGARARVLARLDALAEAERRDDTAQAP